MKLYECPRNSIVKLGKDRPTQPLADEPCKDDIFVFHHVDGMYSYCTTMTGKVFHPAAYTEVTVIGRQERNE